MNNELNKREKEKEILAASCNDPHICQLKHSIEQMVGRELTTPKDFDFLSQQIFSRISVLLSATTLKRIWGYLNEGSTPRRSTLSILSQFVGYRNWQTFIAATENEKEAQSNLILGRMLSAYAVDTGEELILTWLPDRSCKIRCIGECHFKVVESKNTKLSVGDTFDCHLFIEGEPLYIDNLTHDTYEGIAYVAGKQDGIRFELLRETEEEF